MSPRLAVKGSTSAAALLSEEAPAPARPRLAGGAAGDSSSVQALARLNAAVAELKAMAVQAHLQTAIEALRAEQHQAAAEAALKALEQDEHSGFGWYLLAIARDKAGDFKASLQCYEAALQLLPEQADIANDLGRLAYRLGMKTIAERLFLRYLEHRPGSVEAANNLACALRDQNRYGEAIEALRAVITDNPDNALLWNTLGTVLSEQGEFDTAVTFFHEALRCDPDLFRARYNLGNARLALGDADAALKDNTAALACVQTAEERAMMGLARSTILLVKGEVGAGWDAYEARLEPQYADVTHFMIDRPRWTPDSDLEGRTLLLMGEQGLGDEVLFSNLVPDVLEALGPRGKLHLAVEKRLVPLFRRSFPAAVVGAHATYRVDAITVRGAPFVKDWEAIDLWAPIGSLLRRFRRRVEDFPARPAFLRADPARVAHWRRVLADAPPGPKVGLLWKSLRLEGARLRYFSPFEQWAPVLNVPGVCFVNMQYGDCAEEIAEARARLGVEIWTPPGVDLKDDLDEVAALSCALDLLMGPANATSNIAAACGAPVWLISTPAAWPRLGTDRYPWYPTVRVFNPPGFNQWDPALKQMAEALGAIAGRPGTDLRLGVDLNAWRRPRRGQENEMSTDSPETDEPDSQEFAEVFDETNLTEDGGDIANFDEIEDVYDVTSAQGDASELSALDGEDVDPDAFDEDQDEDEEDDEEAGADDDDDEVEGRFDNDDLDDEVSVGFDEDDTEDTDFGEETDVETVTSLDDLDDEPAAPEPEDSAEPEDMAEPEETAEPGETTEPDDAAAHEETAEDRFPHQEELLDEGVEETFPASDPVSVKRIT